jgi:hypothetical protein
MSTSVDNVEMSGQGTREGNARGMCLSGNDEDYLPPAPVDGGAPQHRLEGLPEAVGRDVLPLIDIYVKIILMNRSMTFISKLINVDPAKIYPFTTDLTFEANDRGREG